MLYYNCCIKCYSHYHSGYFSQTFHLCCSRTDQGRNFLSGLIKRFQIKKYDFHPQSSGSSERSHKGIIEKRKNLKKFTRFDKLTNSFEKKIGNDFFF